MLEKFKGKNVVLGNFISSSHAQEYHSGEASLESISLKNFQLIFRK